MNPKAFLVECFGEEVTVRSRDCTFMVPKGGSGLGPKGARCSSCWKADKQASSSGSGSGSKSGRTRPCPLCNREIHERAMTKHIQTMHNTNVVECPLCHKKVKRDGMTKHVKAAHKRSFKCLRCDKKAASVNQVSSNHQSTLPMSAFFLG